MTPLTTTRPSSSDHSYELPLRRNLLLLLDLLDVLRFIAGVLLDRLGVAPCHGGVRLPGGRSWGGGELLVDAAAAERILEAAFRRAQYWSSGSAEIIGSRALYRRVQIAQPRVDDDRGTDSSAEDDDEGAAAVCSICLIRLEARGCPVVELRSCSHAFHVACIDAWVGSGEAATCPLCRAPVSRAAWDGPWPGAGVGATRPRARIGD